MSFKLKLFLSYLCLGLLASSLVSVLIIYESNKMLLQEIKSKVLSIVMTAAALQNGDEHQIIIDHPDTQNPTYTELASQLRKVRDANRRDDIYAAYVYTMYTQKDSPGFVRFSIDAEENPENFSKPGDIEKGYDDIPDLTKPHIFKNPVKDRWGEWVTAGAPIFNSKGEFVSQLSIDVKASDVALQTNKLLRYGLMSFGISIFIAGLLTLFFSRNLSGPITQIIDMVKSIANDNLSVRVSFSHLSEKDELGLIGRELNNMGDKLQERKVLHETLFKFVSPAVAQQVLSAGGLANLAPVRKRVTVLFSDIRNFSTFSENLDPSVVFDQLNEYFERMVEIIYKQNGTLAKFTGDGLMAIFGAPNDDAYQEKNAVEASVKMQLELDQLREKWIAEGKVPIKVGIGIANGIAVVGNYGSSMRREYTAIGDSVNLASRVESATKELNADILITGYVNEAVCGLFNLEYQGLISVKGRLKQVSVYSVNYLNCSSKNDKLKLVS